MSWVSWVMIGVGGCRRVDCPERVCPWRGGVGILPPARMKRVRGGSAFGDAKEVAHVGEGVDWDGRGEERRGEGMV